MCALRVASSAYSLLLIVSCSSVFGEGLCLRQGGGSMTEVMTCHLASSRCNIMLMWWLSVCVLCLHDIVQNKDPWQTNGSSREGSVMALCQGTSLYQTWRVVCVSFHPNSCIYVKLFLNGQ